VFDLTPGGGYKCVLKTDTVKDLEVLKVRDSGEDCGEEGGKIIFSSGSAAASCSVEVGGALGEVGSSSRAVGISYIHQPSQDSADCTGIRCVGL